MFSHLPRYIAVFQLKLSCQASLIRTQRGRNPNSHSPSPTMQNKGKPSSGQNLDQIILWKRVSVNNFVDVGKNIVFSRFFTFNSQFSARKMRVSSTLSSVLESGVCRKEEGGGLFLISNGTRERRFLAESPRTKTQPYNSLDTQPP